jgi:hypothetical protein
MTKFCKTCKTAEVIGKRIYCSNICKFADEEYNSARSVKLKNDPTKSARCKIDGKIIKDEKNLGGHLSTHSIHKLNKEFDWNDWEIIDNPVDDFEYWDCPHCDWKGKTKNGLDGGGWVAKHLDKVHQISKVYHAKQFPNDNGLWPHRLNRDKKKAHINSDEQNHIKCLECGEFFAKISNTHLLNKHGMTMDEYKTKHPSAKVNSQELTNRTREIYFSDSGLSNVSPESNGERDIKLFIQSLGFNTIKFKTGFAEIDIFIPELRIGFEYHGLFYHSQFRGEHRKHRHSDNLNYAEGLGIHLIQIFEDEWLQKQEIVKSRIRNILKIESTKIYARKCEIRFLTSIESESFLTQNHLQGYKYAQHSIGLIYNNEVVQCMTFTDINGRTNGLKIYDNRIFENVRSCTKMNHSVIGGFERLMKYFETNINPIQVISFADRRWSSLLKEPFYIRLGFKFDKTTDNCFWVMKNYSKRQHRSNFTKPKMRQMNPELFANVTNDELTQEKMLKELGFDIIWDCGNLKFIKNYNYDGEPVVIDEFETELETDNIVFGNRKRHLNMSDVITDPNYVQCQLCNQFYKIKGFATHLGFEHKITNKEYISQFGEYRPSHLKNK